MEAKTNNANTPTRIQSILAELRLGHGSPTSADSADDITIIPLGGLGLSSIRQVKSLIPQQCTIPVNSSVQYIALDPDASAIQKAKQPQENGNLDPP